MVKQTNDHELVPSLRNSLLSTMSDPLMDVGEVLFDSVLEDGLLKDIPIIGTIAGLAKAGNKIRERNLAMNTLKFIQGFRCQNVSEDEIQKYRERMDNPKIAEKELGYVLIILDKEIQLEKAKLLGKAYGAFVQGQIQWDKFIEISEAISRMFINDFSLLEKVERNSPLEIFTNETNYYEYQRLEGLGLLDDSNRSETWGHKITSKKYELTPFGKILNNLIKL